VGSNFLSALILPEHYSGMIQIFDIAKVHPGSCAAPVTIIAYKCDVAYIAMNHQ
jgi:hypothetical protein